MERIQVRPEGQQPPQARHLSPLRAAHIAGDRTVSLLSSHPHLIPGFPAMGTAEDSFKTT